MGGTPRGHHGRIAGTPNRDKVELRALIQERVQEFTALRREADIIAGISPDDAQKIVEDYDPVVQLALVAVDRRSTLSQQIQCNAEVAQYVRPKLKSIEVRADEATLEELAEREQSARKLFTMMGELRRRGAAMLDEHEEDEEE